MTTLPRSNSGIRGNGWSVDYSQTPSPPAFSKADIEWMQAYLAKLSV